MLNAGSERLVGAAAAAQVRAAPPIFRPLDVTWMCVLRGDAPLAAGTG